MSHQIERICLSVNSVCNLACGYCYFFAIPDALPGPEALSSEEIEIILGCVHRYSQRPDVHKRIRSILLAAASHCCPGMRSALRCSVFKRQSLRFAYGLRRSLTEFY